MCSAVSCCDVLYSVPCLPLRTCQVFLDDVSCTSIEVHHTTCASTTLLNQLMSDELILFRVVQRITLRCIVVLCLALRRGAVSCCAVLSFERTRYHANCQVSDTRMHACTFLCSLHWLSSLLSVLSIMFSLKNCTRTDDQNVPSRQPAHRAAQGIQLCTSRAE